MSATIRYKKGTDALLSTGSGEESEWRKIGRVEGEEERERERER